MISRIYFKYILQERSFFLKERKGRITEEEEEGKRMSFTLEINSAIAHNHDSHLKNVSSQSPPASNVYLSVIYPLLL